MSLCDVVPTGAEFVRMPIESASVHVLHVARGRSEDGTFVAANLLTKPQGTGMSFQWVPVYDDVTAEELAERIDVVLHHLIATQRVVPCYSSGLAGRFRVLTGV